MDSLAVEGDDKQHDLADLGDNSYQCDEIDDDRIDIAEYFDFYDFLTYFEEALKSNKFDDIIQFCNDFNEFMKDKKIDPNSNLEFFDKLLPLLCQLINPSIPQPLFVNGLISLSLILSMSNYYSLQFASSSFFESIIQVLNASEDDVLNSLILDVARILFLLDELSSFIYEKFPPQTLLLLYQKSKGKLTKMVILKLCQNYILSKTLKFDDNTALQICSCLSVCFRCPDNEDFLKMKIFNILGDFSTIFPNIAIDIFASQGIFDFIVNNFISIITSNGKVKTVLGILQILFQAIKYKKMVFSLPVFDIFQLIIEDKINLEIASVAITMMSNMIIYQDNVLFNQSFHLPNTKAMIQKIMEIGNWNAKRAAITILATIVANHNIETINEYVLSPICQYLIEYFVNSLDDSSFISGILGTILSTLKVMDPNGPAYIHLMTIIIQNGTMEYIEQTLSERKNCETLLAFHGFLANEIACFLGSSN
ncbi:hypothetical protein TRFO_02793 [Tritrichomonas foetus]|uniref:Uncharacterized protein n=1 Tax=Tritrichomonas foetus TaxID=1144522 RepID=A0A1J4KX78_9EUKA|nr:hypothetical protein TRFO_02793 [Tritrichomonas foetus]|eukprot:OHT15488.1 hypothetical protein TRFO_02793 [Tritrichomonas foetus]